MGTAQDQEYCKDEIDYWVAQKDCADKEYFELLDKREQWTQSYRGAHIHWVRAQEELGVPIHHVFLAHGPSHPPSYILYDDGGNLIFQRDSINRYTSFTFWLENLTHPNPIETLGIDYYSSRELRIRPALLKELYELETFYLKGDMSALERIQEIRAIIHAGYVLYKIEKPNSMIELATNEYSNNNSSKNKSTAP
jgi:hypothetical protein